MADEFYGQAPQEEVFDPNGWEESAEYQGVEPQNEQEEYYEEPEQEQEYSEEYVEEPSSDTPLLDQMRLKNYDVSAYSSDEELVADIQSDWAQVNNRQQELQQQMEWLQQNQQQPEEYYDDEEDEYLDAARAVPEFDPAWTNLVEQDESGMFVIRPEYMGSVDPGIAEKVNNYVQWRQERSNSLIESPLDTLMDQGLEEYIEGRINDALNSTLTTQTTQSNAEAFVQEHQDVLFIIDPNTGSPMVDPNTGEEILSPFGNALNNAHVMLLEQGMTNPEQRHQVAVQLAYNEVGSPYQEQAEEEYYEDVEVPLEENNEYYKEQYQEQPFANGPTNPEYMPSSPEMPQQLDGMPQHNSLGSLATQLAVHKGFLQPKS